MKIVDWILNMVLWIKYAQGVSRLVNWDLKSNIFCRSNMTGNEQFNIVLAHTEYRMLHMIDGWTWQLTLHFHVFSAA